MTTPTENIDAALDSILRAQGGPLVHQCGTAALARLREAMRKIMTDSYIQGSNDAHDVMKGKQCT